MAHILQFLNHRSWNTMCVYRVVTKINIIIVTDDMNNIKPLNLAATDIDVNIIKIIGVSDDLIDAVVTSRPDCIVVMSEGIDTPIMRGLRNVSLSMPTPVLIFTEDGDKSKISESVKLGACAYVVGCHDMSRFRSLLEVSMIRFEEQQQLRKELENTKKALAERKIVEKAKGIIMQSKRLSENQAYTAIRKLAMNKNKRVGEIAEQIVSASELLV